MKICILNVLHAPFDKRVFHKVARSLADAGHEVISVAPSNEPVASAHGVQFRVIPPAKSLPHRLVSVWRLIWRGKRENADVYVGVEPESWVSALFIKLMTGRKVVFDVHEPIPPEFAKFFPRPAQPVVEWMTLKFMRLFARFTDHIILTRDTLDHEFQGLRVARSVVINTNHLQPPCTDVPEELRSRYGDRHTIIHQGIFGDTRGSYQLLDAVKIAAREFPDLKCVVLGEYLYGSLDEYEQAIGAAGLEHIFDFPGQVPFEQVPAYIAVSKVGLILFQPSVPAHKYAMPHKLFDYMREGVPVIAPDFAVEVRAIVQETAAGVLVDVARPEDIAEAIIHLLSNPDEAARLGQNGRAAVERKYNWQRCEEVLLAAFTSLQVR